MKRRAFCVSVAFALGGDIHAWVAFLTPDERERSRRFSLG
jgi:hypothetical protein